MPVPPQCDRNPSGVKRGTRLADTRMPTECMYRMDSLQSDTYDITRTSFPHDSKANVVYIDGHVGSLKISEQVNWSPSVKTAFWDGRID
jgi:prepilin-type processing-associated H-X9-DG protein